MRIEVGVMVRDNVFLFFNLENTIIAELVLQFHINHIKSATHMQQTASLKVLHTMLDTIKNTLVFLLLH